MFAELGVVLWTGGGAVLKPLPLTRLGDSWKERRRNLCFRICVAETGAGTVGGGTWPGVGLTVDFCLGFDAVVFPVFI